MPEKMPLNSDTDISDAELQAIQNQVDTEIEQHGLPTDDELLLEVEKLNQRYLIVSRGESV